MTLKHQMNNILLRKYIFFFLDLLNMSGSIVILLIIVLSATITDGRSLNNPDQLIPSFHSSVIADNKDLASSSVNGQNRLLRIIEYIIK
jgi:hypothetical protein